MGMAAFLFTWNPRLFHGWDPRAAAEEFRRSGKYEMDWSSGNTKKPKRGDRFYFIRLGPPPNGIIGRGSITSDSPYRGRPWRASQKFANYCDLKFDALVDGSRQVIFPTQQLLQPPFSTQLWSPRSSGVEIDEQVAGALEKNWPVAPTQVSPNRGQD